jgi:hydrogenase maturation protease
MLTADNVESTEKPRLIIGVGNDFRGDDGAGLLVAQLLQSEQLRGVTILQSSGEGSALIEAWQGYDTVIIVDAASSGAAPGAIHHIDLQEGNLPARLSSTFSSHAFGVVGAIELAYHLQRLPPRLVVYGIEGQDFALGQPMTAPVQAAAHHLAHRLKEQ